MKKLQIKLGIVVHNVYPSPWEEEAGRARSWRPVSSRTARATWTDSVLAPPLKENKQQQQKQNKNTLENNDIYDIYINFTLF